MRLAGVNILEVLWNVLPASWRSRIRTRAGESLQHFYNRQIIARPSNTLPASQTAPIVVAGVFNSAHGIGEGARATFRALKAAGVNPIPVDVSEPFVPLDLESGIKCQPMPKNREGILILQVNGPETATALRYLKMAHCRNWYIIGYWAWELPNFPEEWGHALDYLSEIWTPSSFSASALNQHPKAPKVSIFGHAVSPPTALQSARAKFGWKKGEFVFLTLADSMSSLERKNPFATIRAFRHAFGNAPDRRLVIKTRNLSTNETAKSKIMSEIGDSENISLLDASLTEGELWTLLQSADALVSLHRSEGFGLTIAEAMALSKPVICTNWSGNTDFVTATSAALVDYGLIPCVDPYGVYADEAALWANVDELHAAQLLKRVVEDINFREDLKKQAGERIKAVASPRIVGTQMAARLKRDATAYENASRDVL